MRPLTLLALFALMLTACGAGTTPALASRDATASDPQAMLSAQNYESTWAGGRCWFRQSYSDDSGHRYEVRHNNNGYVRLKVKLINWPNHVDVIEQRYYAQAFNKYAAEVWAWCKVDGQWVGGFKYRTD